jgi:hypothetical protein
MQNTKPYVNVACICEKVLQEKDNVLSAIRLVDTYYLQPPPLMPEGITGAVDLSALVLLKSGDVTGKSELGIQIRAPSGRVIELPEKWPVLLNGGEHGVNFVMKFTMPVREFGLHWFDVVWQGEVLTSFPLKLVLGPQPAAASPDTH